VASIPIVFLLGKHLATDQKRGSAIGLFAAFFIAINAYHIEYAQEFRSYSLTFLLTASSTLLLIKILKDEESKPVWLILYTIISAASVYSHLHAVFIIVAQTVTLPLLLGDKKKYPKLKQILYCLIGIVLLILPIAVIAINKGSNQISWLGVPTFANVIDLYIKISGCRGNWLLILYIVFSCFGLFTGVGFLFRQDIMTKWKFSLLASCLLLPVILAFVISKIIVPIFIDRYLLYVMPYLVLLAASGIVALANFVSGAHPAGAGGSFPKRDIPRLAESIQSPAGAGGFLQRGTAFGSCGAGEFYENERRGRWSNLMKCCY
jgi:4-amino-4-deoxy-L-arabinose transferase-like glycosyltransferase